MSIQVKSLDYAYDHKKVLHNINLTFEKGKFYGILGPNGSGKTTLIKLLTGLLDHQQGEIILNKKKMNTIPRKALAKQIAYVPQMFNVKNAFLVKDIILMGRHPYIKRMHSPSLEDYKKVEEAIAETNIEPLKDRFINELSGGETQRVIIARALAQDTEIIILDEPISQLDIHFQYEIIKFLKKLCYEKNKTIIASLHDIGVALNYCEEVVMLKEGSIKAQGKTKDIITQKTIEETYGLKVNMIYSNHYHYIGW
ncbi:iron complex transport system ATP-binding protein [Natranaerovirga hydrolytica]|uniref:Iron complex transport system ATP-binding protein n=1 Tax=Natranaerovirga hydrolytica TaxID=680378 RepID=A0A4R1MAM2_9FIRM|nr:ABC transporter ATP-binding protein [Natranaerovirga hydrolytica]TCK88004.1 iron complex transport system ATP-binding protein [Natranaerovirga hydrolytica]